MADRSYNSPVTLACLACRTSKTRCDGKKPCQTCSVRNRQCLYQPSRRGGRRTRRISVQKTTPPPDEISRDPGIFEPTDPSTEDLTDINASVTFSAPNRISSSEVTPTTHELSSYNLNNAGINVTPPATSYVSIRAYLCEQDIINAYYIFIHPSMPLLPPPTSLPCTDQPVPVPNVESVDQLQNLLPYWPKSPLSLAISAILVLIPHPLDESPMEQERVSLRRLFAQLYAQASFEAIEKVIDSSDASPMSFKDISPSTLHAHVPDFVEPVLALNLLALYEYCQRSNNSVMRLRINLSITLAMDLSLHNLDSAPRNFSEGLHRGWWSTMFILYTTSSFTYLDPIITLDDPRIRTHYPQLGASEEPWPTLLRSVQSLFMIQKIVEDLESSTLTQSNLSESIDKLCELHDIITSLAAHSTKHVQGTLGPDPDANARQILWIVTRMLVHTCCIRLHGPWAMVDVPVFFDEHCNMVSIRTHGISQCPRPPLPAELITASGLECVFSCEKSMSICLSSALAISRLLRKIPRVAPGVQRSAQRLGPIYSMQAPRALSDYPRALPYFICSAMYSCQSLLVILYKVRNAQDTDQLSTCSYLFPNSEEAGYEEAERLCDEIRTAIESLRWALQQEAAFEGTNAMANEIHNACIAAFENSIDDR